MGQLGVFEWKKRQIAKPLNCQPTVHPNGQLHFLQSAHRWTRIEARFQCTFT